MLDSGKIQENLDSFDVSLIYTKDEGRHPLARYASFDYCFNYFQEKYKNGKIEEIAYPANIQNSCLQLGFYLASWGMYRGSSALLQKSVKVFEPLIKYIAEDCGVWDIDVDMYNEENIQKLIKCRKKIEERLALNQKNMDTLVTKIMLGVFGNVPAFDQYFIKGSKLGAFGEDSLGEISRFYTERKTLIDANAKKITTFEYSVGEKGNGRQYTKAKIIDMIFFIEGLEIDQKNKKEKKK